MCVAFIYAPKVLQMTSEKALSPPHPSIMINICFFFLLCMVHDAHLPVSCHDGLCMHDNTALSKVFLVELRTFVL